MPNAHDNVSAFPDLLARLAEKLRGLLMREAANRTDWIETTLAKCTTLAEMREQFPSHQAFGEWFDATIGRDKMNHNDRAAAITMGKEPEALRACLQDTMSRSLQIIYTKDFGRFTSASKTPRKAPRTAGKPSRATQRDKALAEIPLMEAEGGTVSEYTLASRAGVHRSVARDALLVYRTAHEEQALAAEAVELARAEAGFSKKSKLTLEKAIQAHRARLDRQFDARVNAEVRRRIDTADDHVRKSHKDLQTKYAALDKAYRELSQRLGQRGVFTEAEYRDLIMCVHPDNPASDEVRARIFDIVKQKRDRLINASAGRGA